MDFGFDSESDHDLDSSGSSLLADFSGTAISPLSDRAVFRNSSPYPFFGLQGDFSDQFVPHCKFYYYFIVRVFDLIFR